jgi:MFS family permease
MKAGAPSALRVVAPVGVAQLIGYGGTYYMPAILAAPIGRDLGIAPTWTFAGLSLGLIVSSVMGPAVGRSVDDGGARKALVLGNVAFATGLTLLASAHGLALMTLAWLIMGLGMGLGYYETAFAAMTRLYGASARNLISGVTLIAGFTSTISWPLTSLLDGHFGWRFACLFWAAANLLIALPLNLLLPAATTTASSQPDVPSSEDPSPTEGAPMPGAMIAIAVMFAATSFVSSGLSAVMPTLLVHLGATQSAAIAASALVGPAQIAGRLAELGWLRRFHPAVSARLATMFHPIGVAALLVGGAPFSSVFVILYGIGNGILTISRGTLPLAIFGPLGYGHRIGLLSAPARISGALAPLLLGLLFDAVGPAGLYVTAGLNLVGFTALIFLAHRMRGGG